MRGNQPTDGVSYSVVIINCSPQTELALNTHVTVANTHTMVYDIYRTVVKIQEGAGDQNLSVGAACTLFITK